MGTATLRGHITLAQTGTSEKELFSCPTYFPISLLSPQEKLSFDKKNWELLWIKISFPWPVLPSVHYFLIWPNSLTCLGSQPRGCFCSFKEGHDRVAGARGCGRMGLGYFVFIPAHTEHWTGLTNQTAISCAFKPLSMWIVARGEADLQICRLQQYGVIPFNERLKGRKKEWEKLLSLGWSLVLTYSRTNWMPVLTGWFRELEQKIASNQSAKDC